MCATIISPAPPPNLVGSERNIGPLVYQGTQTVRPLKSRLVMQPYSLHQIDYSASRLTSKVACALMQAFYHPDDQNEAREWRRSSVESAMSEVIIHTHWNPCATLSAYILAQYRVLHSLYAAPVIQTSALIASIPDVMTEPTIARKKVCEWTHAHAHVHARTHAPHLGTQARHARAHTHHCARCLGRMRWLPSSNRSSVSSTISGVCLSSDLRDHLPPGAHGDMKRRWRHWQLRIKARRRVAVLVTVPLVFLLHAPVASPSLIYL